MSKLLAGLRNPLLALLAALAALATATAGPALAADPLVKISTDPYTNSQAQHRSQVEPDTFAFGKTVVSAFQSGRVNNGGSSNIGWATSLDGGRTWTHGFLPGTTVNATPAGHYFAASDATVAFDAMHKVWIISFLGLSAPGGGSSVDLLVSRSTDGGLTWGLPVVVSAVGQFLDKNWTVCDNHASTSPFYGNCYTEFDNNTLGDLEQMSTSSDGGLTWGPAKGPADSSHGLGGQPLVEPNGAVVVPYVGLDSSLFLFTISSFMSVDGGNSWSASTVVSEADFHDPNPGHAANTGIRADIPLPSAEIDHSGKIYVVWSDCRFEVGCNYSDIVMSTTTDGIVWTPVERIPITKVGSRSDHFIPGLGVDEATGSSSAKLALTYYYYPFANCTVSTCELNLGIVTSNNGGKTWSKAEQLAGPMNLTWLPATTQGYMVGDYISTSIAPRLGTAAPVFAVAHAPTGSVLDQAMYTVTGELAGGSLSGAGATPVAKSTLPAPSADSGPTFRRRVPTAF